MSRPGSPTVPTSPHTIESPRASVSSANHLTRVQLLRPSGELRTNNSRPTSQDFTNHSHLDPDGRRPSSPGVLPSPGPSSPGFSCELKFKTADQGTKRLRAAAAIAKTDRIRHFVLLWGYCFILTLDGGGVRGYSQLLILKALMDKIEAIERRETIGGIKVESSFHPIQWADVPTTPAERGRRKPQQNAQNAQSTPSRSSNGSTSNGNEKSRSTEVPVAAQSSRFYPHHYFDWIAGTSTGGLNAIMLSRLRMSVDDCLEEYADLARQVFGHSRWASYRFTPLFWPCAKYSKDTLEQVVKNVVEDNLREGEGDCFAMNPNMCRTLVFAWGHNKGTGSDIPSLFRSYAHHQRRKNVVGTTNGYANLNPIEKAGPADSCLIWEAARATSAAPSYFNSIKIGQMEYMDGGFGLNNPSNRVFYEVSQVNRDVHEANALSVSIGTGISRFTRFQQGSLKRIIGWLNGAKKVSTDCETSHEDMSRTTGYGNRHRYHRFNVPEPATDPDGPEPSVFGEMARKLKRLSGQDVQPLDRGLGKIKLDEWKPKRPWRKESTQEEIYRITQKYLQDEGVDRDLNDIARLMVDQRRARAQTPRWESYALGIRYECPMARERCPEETFIEASALREHLIRDHAVRKEEHLARAISAGKYYEYHH